METSLGQVRGLYFDRWVEGTAIYEKPKSVVKEEGAMLSLCAVLQVLWGLVRCLN